MPKKVFILLLNWNGKNDTIECVESLKKVTYDNFEIVLVDNGSKDGSQKYLKKHYPNIKLIETYKNIWFAGGNNVGINYILKHNPDYILLLNNDTIVRPNFLENLLTVAESDKNTGIVGPKIFYNDSPNKIWFAGGKINWKKNNVPSVKHIGQDEIDTDQYNNARSVDFVSGCALLIKNDVIKKIGLLDPDYFLYYEDTDWCVRAKNAGFNILYVPQSVIYHKIMQTINKSYLKHGYFVSRNRMKLVKKHLPLNIKLRIYTNITIKTIEYALKKVISSNSANNFFKSGEFNGYVDFFLNKNRYHNHKLKEKF